jgi:hypothetical protein
LPEPQASHTTCTLKPSSTASPCVIRSTNRYGSYNVAKSRYRSPCADASWSTT